MKNLDSNRKKIIRIRYLYSIIIFDNIELDHHVQNQIEGTLKTAIFGKNLFLEQQKFISTRKYMFDIADFDLHT